MWGRREEEGEKKSKVPNPKNFPIIVGKEIVRCLFPPPTFHSKRRTLLIPVEDSP